jgi:hypothetical protein
MRRLISLLVSAAILAVIYAKVEPAAIAGAFRRSSPGWLAASLGMVVPLTLLTAHRLVRIVPPGRPLRFGESLSLTLAGSAMNMVLPSKMGDVAKGWFLTSRGHLRGGEALALVVFEKGFDMLSLLLWCALGLFFVSARSPLFWPLAAAVALGTAAGILMLLSPGASARLFALLRRVARGKLAARLDATAAGWRDVQESLLAAPGRLAYVGSLSIFLWFLHLLQIWMFIVALGGDVPFLASLGLAPLAILAGLLPLTFAGVGTRDAALIVLYQPWLAPAAGAALGVLCTMRYLLPGIAGLPVLGRYLGEMRRERSA